MENKARGHDVFLIRVPKRETEKWEKIFEGIVTENRIPEL